LADDEGLLIESCWSIHMLFMFFSLDCVYLSDELKILKIARGVPPFWFSWSGIPLALHTLELPAGTAERVGLEVGQTLRFEPATPASD
jgi:uncharacterized membrane protein (UPF0127 family)